MNSKAIAPAPGAIGLMAAVKALAILEKKCFISFGLTLEAMEFGSARRSDRLWRR